MIKLGFLINNTAVNQLAHSIIMSGNVYLKNNSAADLVIFRQNLSPNCVRPNFAVMDTAEAYGFDGVVVATDLDSAAYLAKCPGPCKKIFYINDLEWITSPQKIYEKFAPIYQNLDFEIIVRSTDHAAFMQSCWNRKPAAIISSANINDFFNYLNGEGVTKIKPRTYVEGLFYAN